MKQQKNEKTPSLREQFLALPDQEAVNHYFHLHNAAGYIYNSLSDEAKVYVDHLIELSMESLKPVDETKD